tara:strand:- start:64479 stop:64751 length:273 start_codon:yes stop_codon:yes gene_type:complete
METYRLFIIGFTVFFLTGCTQQLNAEDRTLLSETYKMAQQAEEHSVQAAHDAALARQQAENARRDAALAAQNAQYASDKASRIFLYSQDK